VTPSRAWLGVAVSAGAAVVLLGACTFPVRFATPAEVQQALNPSPPPSTGGGAAPAPATAGGLTQVQTDLRRLIAQVGPSVVRVDAGSSSGSGLVIDGAGTIVTTANLVAGSQQVTITLATGQQYPGTVVGSDQATDIAVVRVSGASGLTAVTFGDSSAVQVGDVVLVIGNQVPSSATVSQGIVSAISSTGPIQTTAPVSAGTSGSALVDVTGQVIGMTTLGSTGASGLAVAIPSNQVNSVAGRLVAGGSGSQAGTAHIGVTATDAAGGGALIQSVVAGGPAARAGFQVGWTIVGIGGHSVSNAAAIGQILATFKPGQSVVVTVQVPNGSTRSITVVLGA
jgi:putative serine protease PepD